MSEGNFVLYGLLVMYIIFDKKYLQFWQYCGIINCLLYTSDAADEILGG